MARTKEFKPKLKILSAIGFLTLCLGIYLVRSSFSRSSVDLKSADRKLDALQQHTGTVLGSLKAFGSTEPSASPSSIQNKDLESALQVANKICSSPTLSVFSNSTTGCESELSQLYASLDSRIEQYSSGGVILRRENCSAQSPDGLVSTADGVLSDLYAIGKELLVKRIHFDFDRDLPEHHLNRMRLVALCHIQKNIQYWLNHPEQMPEGDEIENHLLFDHNKGQPGSSKTIGFFLKALSQVEQMRRGQN